MTAPLTPHGQPPNDPQYPARDPVGDEPAEHGRSAGAEARRFALVAIAVAVCGVLFGLLWLWLAPRIPMVSDGNAVYLQDTEGEEAVGADGVFVLVGLAMGVMTAAAVYWRNRSGGVTVVLGLALGGVLGSLIAWRLGVALGPTTDVVAHAKAVGPKVVFDGPLELRAKGALVAWPVGAMLTFLCLTSAFGPREPQQAPPYWAGEPQAPHGQPPSPPQG